MKTVPLGSRHLPQEAESVMSELFGILQLDRGEPWGYAQIPGLIQAWLQDAGGFAAVGLIAYLAYALSTPTDKSESERLRVPVSTWMLTMGAIALICYSGVAALLLLEGPNRTQLFGQDIAPPEQPPPPPGMPVKIEPPAWHPELRPMLLMIAGFFALLGIAEPFTRDLIKIARRNISFGSSGITRFINTLRSYAATLLTPNRVIALVAAVGVYALVGVILFAVGATQLVNIWTGVLLVALGVFVSALAVLMLFEAEGPVWAIAKLSFKECVRNNLLWVFLIFALPFLFPLQWFYTGKPEDELRTTTAFVTVVLTLLTLIPAGIIASLGIDQDVKSLSIYTVVTKPVERFEIVLGRFVGYVSLMSLVLLALTGVTLVLVTNSNISESARAETYKARVPHRGKLEFKSLPAAERMEKKEFEGTNVGREFDYRRYIAGHSESPQRAIWHFATLPSEMETAEGARVPVEFTFDIFRMTKGEQNKGVSVTFRFVTYQSPQRQPEKQHKGEWQWVDKAKEDEYRKAVEEYVDKGQNPNGARPGEPGWIAVNALAERFGYYEVRGKEVLDYRVMGIEVPAGLFRNANQGQPEKGVDGKPLPRLSVYVKCESEGQLLGMAEPDLYLLRNEMPYAVNFLKGTVGLWCRLCLVIGLAVAGSTYLSGILVMILTTGIYIVGLFGDHLNDMANNRNVGGGPFESMSRLVKAEQPTTPLSDSAGIKTILFADKGVAWLYRRVQNVIPDVESFSWGHFVAEGFNINAEYLVVNLLITFGYLLPWAILAYYLMKSREVAA